MMQGLRFNGHMDEAEGPLVFQRARISLRTLAGLDQEQEPDAPP
jgi:hypothetical protein